MRWLSSIVDEIERLHPGGDLIVSSGVSPSGTYHLGTLRDVLTAEAVMRELQRRGRAARHLHIVDDLDVFRKVPKGLPESYEQYLGMPLCDIPAPDGSDRKYADYYLGDLLEAAESLQLKMEVVRAHEKYRAGFFVPAIEMALKNADSIREVLETVSGRKLDDQYSPIQVIENGRLKNRSFTSIDTTNKTVKYLDADQQEQQISYADGMVKLSWRIDWPARWWLLGVAAEPFGRDHATKGGSSDTGAEIICWTPVSWSRLRPCWPTPTPAFIASPTGSLTTAGGCVVCCGWQPSATMHATMTLNESTRTMANIPIG